MLPNRNACSDENKCQQQQQQYPRRTARTRSTIIRRQSLSLRMRIISVAAIVALTFSVCLSGTSADSSIMKETTTTTTTIKRTISLSTSDRDVLAMNTPRNEGLTFLRKKQQTKITGENNNNNNYYYNYNNAVEVKNRDREHRKLQPASLQQCKIALAVGDTDRDDVLSKDEYLNVVNQLGRQNQDDDEQYVVVSSFDELPTALKDNYDEIANDDLDGINISGSKPGQIPTVEQDIQLNELCESTQAIILGASTNSDNDNGTIVITNDDETTETDPTPSTPTTAPQPIDCSATVDRGQCNVDLSISDSYQNNLLDKSDYVKFVNRLSNNEYSGKQFEQLPKNMQENYNSFATKDGQVDISGSKPGQRVSTEQDAFIDAFCCETDWAVQNPGTSITLEPSVAPKPSESGMTTSAPTFDLFFCQRSMASSDLDRDDRLNEQEYLVFLNRLTNNEFIDILVFDGLDTSLKLNFNILAETDGQIDIYGSKPGQTANLAEESTLVQICLDTASALSGVSSPTIAPVTSAPSITIETPTADPQSDNKTFPPTFGEFTCYSAMGSSDSNGDNYLNETEYVDFINRLTGNAFEGMTFVDLPPSFLLAYEDLESGNETGIYIFGSKPADTADSEQDDFLQLVCIEVAIALSQIEGWTPAPSISQPSSPSFSPGSIFMPGQSEVYNSFIISNRGGLTAADLAEGTSSRTGLDLAYAVFAQNSIDAVVPSEINKPEFRKLQVEGTTSLRRRKLEVVFLPNSDLIYLILDSKCPDNLSSEDTCQTAFAKFQVTITNENPQVVSTEYTEYTQALIADRVLDIILNEVDQRTILKIVNASFPVIPDIAEITVAPTNAPTEDTSSDRNNIIGPIVGGILGVLILCAIIGYVSVKGCPFPLPSLRKGGGRVGNKADDDDDDEGGLGFGQDDDDASVGDKDESFGKPSGFGVDRSAFGSNDEEEQERTDGDKNRFGFTKKNKKNDEEDNDFGLDSQTNSNANSFGAGDNMYAFDEPSEVDSETEDQDERSVGDNEDIIFGGTSSPPAWGNASNAFASTSANQGWGANGGEDNFFGAPAFEEEQNEEQFSQSGSESESYSSEDDTYDSGEAGESEEISAGQGNESGSFGMEEEDQHEEDSYSGSSADDEDFDDNNSYAGKSLSKDEMSADVRMKNDDMDAAIESGDWDAVAKAANSFENKSDQDSSVAGSSKIGAFSQDDIEGDSYSGSYSESGDASASSATTATEERGQREEYRAQVDALVRQVLPDETEKVDAMMDQFKGREAELVSTLQTMQERSSNQRARSAVHKSKGRSQEKTGAYSIGGANGGGVQGGEGSTAGTAAIAAASLPIPASGMFDEENDNSFDVNDGAGFGREDAFGDASKGEDYEEKSEYSDEGSRSYYSDEDEDGSRSYYSDEDGSGSRSFYSEGSESPSGSRSGSVSHSHTGSHSGSGSRSFYSEDGSGSRRSRSESRSGSGNRSESASRSGIGSASESGRGSGSGSGSRSYYSDEGSYYSGEEGSYYSEEEESPNSK
jgi:hypothetical protein